MQVTDEALARIAQAVRDRDVMIAFLQQRLADLSTPADPVLAARSSRPVRNYRGRVPRAGMTARRPPDDSTFARGADRWRTRARRAAP